MPEAPATFRPPWQPRLAERDRKAALDRTRGNSSARGYDWQWRKVRAAVLAEEPLCRFCAGQGVVTAAEVVDHIDGNSRNNARSNLRPLCKRHHDQRTARDQGFNRGKGGGGV